MFPHEALEKLHETQLSLAKLLRYPRDEPDSERRQWRIDAEVLRRCTPYYWNAKTVEVVNALAPSFKLDEITTSRHLVHSDYAWHYFGEKAPLKIRLGCGAFKEGLCKHEWHFMPVRAISTYVMKNTGTGEDFLGATAWLQTMEDDLGNGVGSLNPAIWVASKFGENMTSRHDLKNYAEAAVDLSRPPDREWLLQETSNLRGFMIAAGTFLRQKLLLETTIKVERHARKRLERRGYSGTSDISVIHLRRSEPHKATNPSESHPVDWSCQWAVGAHVRQQWYPSLKEHLPILIEAYTKGPEDKPMKPRTTPIFKVVR